MNSMHRYLIVIGLLVYCLAFQGSRSLWEPDEGRYTAVAMEMLRGGDWLKPQLHHEQPHWTKPPLTYWVIAASVSLLGRNEFAARLATSLPYLLTIILVYLLGRVFLKERAWLAPIVYSSFLLPFIASNIITTDGLLTLWETMAITAFAYANWGDDRSAAPVWMLVMWGAFGLAFLTKGPPGLLPLTAVIFYRLLRRRSPGSPGLQWFPGLIIMLAIGMSWFILIFMRWPELVRYFIVHEVYGRVVTGEHGRNSEWYKAITIYLPVLLLGTLPWTFWLVRYVYRNVRLLFQFWREYVAEKQGQDIFLLLWLICPLLIFMVSSSRLPLYLLPLFAPLSILASRGLEAAAFRWNRRNLAMTAVWFLMLLSLRLIVAEIPTDKDAAAVAQAIRASASTPYNEIAFYATDPMEGLNFYLDRGVEAVGADMLEDELAEGENPLWIMRPKSVSRFRETTAALGRNFQEVGRIGARYFFLQESDMTGAVP